jgi:hypothetical protein
MTNKNGFFINRHINKDVNNILHYINPNTIGIEIGVWAGDSSKKFIDRGITHLHLVDSWSVDAYMVQKNPEKGSYENFLQIMSKHAKSAKPEHVQKFFDALHDFVYSRYSSLPQVTIHRKPSAEFFSTFAEKVDWVYVDGAHSYDECLEDLIASLSVIKPGGWLLGDDYEWELTRGKPGVTKAVNEFVKTRDLTLVRAGERQFIIGV